uniref:Uncharacterized protein TCIL3000_7_4600 n=1 Tax=Trypanosoma congolense (strain IL3000) TaxID=1068625 RepID=G0UQI5_TRYCI|nr:unnamed protein product [Trypanosoma congolense IL3000]
MRFSAVLRCVTSGTTLTKKISHLAERVEQHLSTPHDGLAPDARAQAVDDLWQQVVATVPSARALKETDTLLALVCRMLRYGVKPAHDKAASTTWSVLIGDLAPYSDIEANSVLAYPGTVESFLGGEGAMGNALCGNTNGNRDSGEWEGPPLLQLTRETLLLTGGVVPLSSRVPCTDGRVLGQLLGAFCGCCESVAESSVCGDALTKSCLLEVSAAVLNALKVFEDAITGENCKFLNPPLLRLLRLLVRLDHERGSQQNKQGSVSLEFTEDFCERLTNVLPTNALGARIVLHFIFEQHNLFPEEMVPLALVCVAFRGVWLRYAKADDSFPCLKHLQSMNEAVDVTLQRNANNNNLLGLREGDEAELRLLLSVALLRGMRLHADSPEEFLRNAISIVDSCPASISVEYEILMAKTKLLEMFSDDETSCSAIYDDLLQSLRAIVELDRVKSRMTHHRPTCAVGKTFRAATKYQNSGTTE